MAEKQTNKRIAEIERCLKQHQKLLFFVTDALERNDQLTMEMEPIFTSMCDRLDTLQNTIKPMAMFEETKKLEQLKLNANLTLSALDPVINHYQVIRPTDWMFSQGPTGRLKDYLDCLDKIKRAAEYFEKVIPEGTELKALRLKLNAAKELLQSEFSRLLLTCSNPASPVDILNLIGPEEVLDTQIEDAGIPMPVLQDMAAISTWLLEDDCIFEDIEEDSPLVPKGKSGKRLKTMSLHRDTWASPQKKTASWLSSKLKTRSLDRPSALRPLPHCKEDSHPRGLPDIVEEQIPLGAMSSQSRLKTRSLDCMESPNTFKAPLPGSPFVRKTVSWMSNKMKTRSLDRHPGLEPVHSLFRGRLQPPFNIFSVYSRARSRRLNRSLKDFKDHLRKTSASSTSPCSSSVSSSSSSFSSSSSSSSIGSSLKDSITRIFKRLGKEGWCDIDVESYSQCIKAFNLLAKVEFSALTNVFPQTHWKRVFDPLVQKALDVLIEDGECIIFAVRHAVNVCHDYSALLSVLRALQHLKAAQPDIIQVLKYTSSNTKDKVPSLIESIGTFALQTLARYPGSITNKKREMPKDGTVHELTSNVILFLSQLVQLKTTAELFASRESTSERGDRGAPNDDVKYLRPFISEVLEQLFLSLENMAAVYEDSALKAIFLFNNSNYIHNAVAKAQLREVWVDSTDAPQAVWEGRMEEQRQKYLQSWSKVTKYLSDDGMPSVQSGSKPKEKERHMMKRKLKGFSDSIDDMLTAQSQWSIPDQTQREDLCEAVVSMVGKDYRAFLERYKNVKFSRHPERYYKYSPEKVEEMIQQCFKSLT